MMLSTLQAARGKKVVWEKYNVQSGVVEQLTGELVTAGVSAQICNTEYVIIEEPGGRQWIATPLQVKELM